MNKLLYTITLTLCITYQVQATNYTATIQAGQLETSIESPSSITELALSGSIDIRDFSFIADSLRQLSLLDLSNCTISAWESRENYLGEEYQFASNTIPAYAFLGLENLSTVKLPTNTVKIGNGAFAGCPRLETIEWGEQLQEIGDYAFTGDSLLNTPFPSTLTTVGDYAFENCVAYTTIDLSQTQIQNIGNHAFANCTSAATISLPASIKSLGNNTFAGCTALTAIDIPSSISHMGNSCFAHCSNLTTVNIKECEQLTSIAPYTFDHCTRLERLETPASITEIGEGAFYYCRSLITCSLPASTQRIGDYAFAQTAIAELNFLPEGIEDIGRWPFYSLTNLQTAILPSTLITIGDHAFDHCIAINSLYCEAAVPPVLGENVFQDVPQAECLLYLPEESISLYKDADQWRLFNIYIPNSKEEIAVDESLKAFFMEDELTIQSQIPLHTVSLYTVDGQLIYTQQGSITHLTIHTQAYSSNIFILSVQKESGEYTHLKLGRTH